MSWLSQNEINAGIMNAVEKASEKTKAQVPEQGAVDDLPLVSDGARPRSRWISGPKELPC